VEKELLRSQTRQKRKKKKRRRRKERETQLVDNLWEIKKY